jgi:hypothetical protein
LAASEPLALPRPMPLEWPPEWARLTRSQRWLMGMPFVGLDRQSHKLLSVQLSSRGEEYRAAWTTTAVPEAVWSRCLTVVREAGLWSSDRFIPEDPFAIVMWKYGDPLVIEEVLEDTAACFGRCDRVPWSAWAQVWSTYAHTTYGAFLMDLWRERRPRP